MDELNGYSSGDSIKRPALPLCDACKTNEMKYKCPKCLKLSCSLQCVKTHKQQSGCDGTKPLYEKRMMPLSEMNLKVLRKDMCFIEKGINYSNAAKRDNLITAKVEIDMQKAKRSKNLKQFLKKQRECSFKAAP